jgi:hypothetical protein|tara:strand:+ start:345 stop:614 length:270 start_codon:yes stop_codon:yes gene_type:complete
MVNVVYDYGMFSQGGNDAVQGLVNAVVTMAPKVKDAELTDYAERLLQSLSFVEIYSESWDTMVRENYFAQINYELSDSDPNIQNPGVLT